jgi:hypothetical protein
MSKYAKGPERWLPMDPPPSGPPQRNERLGITPPGCICGCSFNMGLVCPVHVPGKKDRRETRNNAHAEATMSRVNRRTRDAQ